MATTSILDSSTYAEEHHHHDHHHHHHHKKHKSRLMSVGGRMIPGWSRCSTRQWIRDFRDYLRKHCRNHFMTIFHGKLFWTLAYYHDMIPHGNFQKFLTKYPSDVRGSTDLHEEDTLTQLAADQSTSSVLPESSRASTSASSTSLASSASTTQVPIFDIETARETLSQAVLDGGLLDANRHKKTEAFGGIGLAKSLTQKGKRWVLSQKNCD